MPLSVVVGGQFGSEGKGKTTLFFAKEQKAKAVVRVGGPNSGHTVLDENDNIHIFKNLPVSAILSNVYCVLTPGNYINLDILFKEIENSGVSSDMLIIDPLAMILTEEDIENENRGRLKNEIGSTCSGTGQAVSRRVKRLKNNKFAKDIPELQKYLKDTKRFLRNLLNRDERIIIEGTQGYGLSVLHSQYYPYTTSRDTTAAAFVSEAGLSPLDVDDVIMVLRAHPIRVAGNSGPLDNETDWETITKLSGKDERILEYTSVTKKIRRIAQFDASIVKEAISVNNPTKIVLNHVDYLDVHSANQNLSLKAREFILNTEQKLKQKINFIGMDNKTIVKNQIHFSVTQII